MKIWKWTLRPRVRRFFLLCRWLHIYLSTAIFSLLVFFSVTGISLNHPDWQGTAEHSVKTYPLPEKLVKELLLTSPVLDTFTNYVEELTGLKSPREVKIDRAFNEITLDYPLPAGYAYVVISADSQLVEVSFNKGSWLALWNDLHKGRHSGIAWSVLIDVSAIFMLFFAVTGMIILLQNPRFRYQGLRFAAFGALTPVLIYLLMVPSF